MNMNRYLLKITMEKIFLNYVKHCNENPNYYCPIRNTEQKLKGSNKELAELLEVKPALISAIFDGKRNLTYEKLRKFVTICKPNSEDFNTLFKAYYKQFDEKNEHNTIELTVSPREYSDTSRLLKQTLMGLMLLKESRTIPYDLSDELKIRINHVIEEIEKLNNQLSEEVFKSAL